MWLKSLITKVIDIFPAVFNRPDRITRALAKEKRGAKEEQPEKLWREKQSSPSAKECGPPPEARQARGSPWAPYYWNAVLCTHWLWPSGLGFLTPRTVGISCCCFQQCCSWWTFVTVSTRKEHICLWFLTKPQMTSKLRAAYLQCLLRVLQVKRASQMI